MVCFKQPFQPFDKDEYKQKFQRVKIAYLESALERLKSEGRIGYLVELFIHYSHFYTFEIASSIFRVYLFFIVYSCLRY